ncbi:valine--tRNA ligase [Bradyrhizobium sp. LHD-71]|uniref:valine--tRNA ligase n=1 Tax=Bradyrhizobium sp. LHD-71 TaxID=3072141 RepID=UPI00280F42AA|nr:valine--tRNA ligase [Bradyrhizobium sp. LHD-71]MDQ8730081.1 valine--tRNA ligase [Bradyrhizobium sp. LHD-71]
MIEKNYQPADIEGRMSRLWEEAGAFRAGRAGVRDAKPFTIVIPPPNVTGSLHMGHALNNTLQDILCRFERMRGRDVLWQPGTDHAGIATQMVVERQLMERQEPGRRAMGREKFLDRVWQWKAESGGTIVNQLKRLGASCDWSRERFTMDEGLSRAVLKVFVELYRADLIYKDKRLVNWDPALLTAISDLEVQQTEVKGHMWHFRYPLADDPSQYLCIATTRPETMLGDGAVAVHPDDERYKHLVGKLVRLPLAERLIPVIADEYPDPEKGSGAVKITAAHDFNDFEVWQRHRERDYFKKQLNGGLINLFTPAAELNENCPPQYRGLDRYAARKRIVADLEALGLVDKIEPHVHMVPHGDRSGVVIEPLLTDQWYVDAKTLARPAITAVQNGSTRFVPKNYEKTYFDWMENIQPWCISRQLWWGHQIPAWYGPDDRVFVAETEEEAVGMALGYYVEQEVITPEQGREMALDPAKREGFITRDEDVLDTWFSSALWPFSTLGWPDDTPEVKRYYPTNTLVTGFDIIFFWVARMMMMGLQFMKEVPFKDIYIHGIVRDEKGAKMSKSKGNVVDPLELIDDFGADALRFTMASLATPGRDVKPSRQRIEGYRNFATKLWNAARFAEMNACALPTDFDPKGAKETLNRWIAHETSRAAREVTEAIEGYRFNEAASAVYRFIWNVYCDWYLELAKPVLSGPDGAAKAETRAMVAWARDEILKLLHPFMPFITEELWDVTAAGKRGVLLTLTEWPSLAALDDEAAEGEIGWVVDLVTAVRSLRSEMNIAPATLVPLVLVTPSAETEARAQRWTDVIKRLARVSEISSASGMPQGAVQLLVRGEVAALPLKGVIDLAAEKSRLEKEVAKAEADIKRVDAKLGNADFMARAPEEVVEEQRERREEAEARRTKILEALERLRSAA